MCSHHAATFRHQHAAPTHRTQPVKYTQTVLFKLKRELLHFVEKCHKTGLAPETLLLLLFLETSVSSILLTYFYVCVNARGVLFATPVAGVPPYF